MKTVGLTFEKKAAAKPKQAKKPSAPKGAGAKAGEGEADKAADEAGKAEGGEG